MCPSAQLTLNGYKSLSKLARAEGFEPPTVGLENRCSIQLSYTLNSTQIRWEKIQN